MRISELAAQLSLRAPSREALLVLMHRGALGHELVRQLIPELRSRFQAIFELPFSSRLLTVEEVDRVDAQVRAVLPAVPSAIISIGGGTVMDLSKVLKFRLQSSSSGPILQAAIPTTAGTGSEATPFAVVYQDGKKISVEDSSLLPEIAVLEPALLMNLSREAALFPALDALSQAIESLWAVRATDHSVELATNALKRIIPNLVGFVEQTSLEPSQRDPELIRSMQLGANLAGQAIAITRTTAAHALSYRLTATHGIPHGLAVFVSLPRILLYNSESPSPLTRERIARVCALLSAETSKDAAERLFRLARTLRLSMRLEDYGLNDGTRVRAWIEEAATNSRSTNNPRALEPERLLRIFSETP